MSATTDLVFHPDIELEPAHVMFTLQMLMIIASDPGTIDNNAQLTSRAGTFMICADDDKITRMMYTSLAKKCGVTTCTARNQLFLTTSVQATEFQVPGETFDEADSIMSVVKAVATPYDERTLVDMLKQR